MISLWILFALLHAGSIGFALLSLWRLYEYIKRYRFDESKYTLLFGFLHLSWIATGYIIVIAGWFFISYMIFVFQ